MKICHWLLLLLPLGVHAEAVKFSDYRMLSTGMSEAEILYRLGPPDHETAVTDYHHFILSKTWYYIPTKRTASSRKWISEITFNLNGRVANLRRYRP